MAAIGFKTKKKMLVSLDGTALTQLYPAVFNSSFVSQSTFVYACVYGFVRVRAFVCVRVCALNFVTESDGTTRGVLLQV